MRRTGETYREHQERVKCMNCSSLAKDIVNPQCVDGKQEYGVKVIYNELESSEEFLLCSDCTEALVRDAKKHGYDVLTRELEE